MKIIFCGLEYDRYNPRLGNSFEYINFYESLKVMPGIEALFHSFQNILTLGIQGFNDSLLALVKKEKPAMVFVMMYTDEMRIETLKLLQRETITVAWFSDDHWRFDNYSRHYAPYFNWVITTYSKAPERYRQIGQNNVIRSQWFCNPDTYKPISTEKDIAVSFVGLKNRGRAEVIDALKNNSTPISVFGNGWEGGKLSQNELIRLFSRSRINLNLNNPRSLWEPFALGRLVARRSIHNYIPDFHFINNFRSWRNMGVLQIKARPFEIAACRGFCISGYADDLDTYYKESEEMVFYRTKDDLIEKIHYYLEHDAEREEIAEAGYQRTLKDHTYEKRFADIFKQIGLLYEKV